VTFARRLVGRGFVGAYRGAVRAWGKVFSVLAGGAFASFGRHSVLQPPVRLDGEWRIAIGSDVYVGAGSWLQVIDGDGDAVALELGDGTSIQGGCILSAVSGVRLGRKVLLARHVYVSDHTHAFDDTTRAVVEQGVDRVAPVEICDGAWIGENVVVCPGVRIGRGAVVGANAVVTSDVPDHSVAVGAPARVVRTFAPQRERVA
jgi:acetyltransferase-like isoleucine patch superfamily enzyme